MRDPLPANTQFPNVDQLVALDQARMAVAMTRIYRIAGFGAVVAAQQASLRSLAEQVRTEGGKLDGWCP